MRLGIQGVELSTKRSAMAMSIFRSGDHGAVKPLKMLKSQQNPKDAERLPRRP